MPAVCFGVGLGGLGGMVSGVVQMALCSVGMVRGGMVIAGLMVFGGLAMMMRGVLMVLGGLPVMLDSMARHRRSPFSGERTKRRLERTPG